MTEKKHQRTDLPKPGELLRLDFRSKKTGSESAPSSEDNHTDAVQSIKLLQWNIERGYKLEAVIQVLKAIDADVIALQEVDIGCERSGGEDTGRRIAESLGLQYVFLCEFEELWSPLRDQASQGGGVHGNAILSRFDIMDVRVVQHRSHPVDWDATHARGPPAKEPRRGRRAVLAATVQAPAGPLLVYCVHLEVFCGMLARIAQFADIIRDGREQLRKGIFHQAILGDLNTMAHGVARLSPHYCCDVMRWRSLGSSEAQWWDRYVLSASDNAWQPVSDQVRGQEVTQEGAGNARLKALGVREDVTQDVLNPGFKDPFNVAADITLDNPAYKFWGISLMSGKLDWVLLRRLQAVNTGIGNHDYAASDHKWLSADVRFTDS
mmetsp:Transcript_8371/g.25104  ORF Transcript_8371/g.25104 Transcript_8371/m.25104 type:complete len:379 (+) Transcript_8371:2625-3761(+)